MKPYDSIKTMYKSKSLIHRKKVCLNNDVVIVTTDEQANKLSPLTLYSWIGRLNVNLRMYNSSSQFGDMVFSNKEDAVIEKIRELKFIQKNVNDCINDLKEEISTIRRIRSIAKKLYTFSMENSYLSKRDLDLIISRYELNLTLNEFKNLSLIMGIQFKSNNLVSIWLGKKSKLKIETIIKIIEKLRYQIKIN